MLEDAKQFLKEKQKLKNNGGRNRLFPFKAEIQFLKENGMTNQEVTEFLAKKGVKITPSVVAHFYRKHIKSAKESVQSTSRAPQKKKESYSPPPWADQNVSVDDLI